MSVHNTGDSLSFYWMALKYLFAHFHCCLHFAVYTNRVIIKVTAQEFVEAIADFLFDMDDDVFERVYRVWASYARGLVSRGEGDGAVLCSSPQIAAIMNAVVCAENLVSALKGCGLNEDASNTESLVEFLRQKMQNEAENAPVSPDDVASPCHTKKYTDLVVTLDVESRLRFTNKALKEANTNKSSAEVVSIAEAAFSRACGDFFEKEAVSLFNRVDLGGKHLILKSDLKKAIVNCGIFKARMFDDKAFKVKVSHTGYYLKTLVMMLASGVSCSFFLDRVHVL